MTSVCRYFVQSKRQKGKHVCSNGRSDDSFTVPGVCKFAFHIGLLIDASSRLYLFVERGVEKSTTSVIFWRHPRSGRVCSFAGYRFLLVRDLAPIWKWRPFTGQVVGWWRRRPPKTKSRHGQVKIPMD